MSPELVQLFSSGGAGIAVVVVTLVFLKYLKVERKELMADRREERREFLDRLEQTSKSIEGLTRALVRRPCMLKDDQEDRTS